MWCRGCYKYHNEDDFAKEKKKLGGLWERVSEGRYGKGTTGDHILTHFQCDLFHFRNINGRDPNRLRQEDNILIITI